MKRAFIELRLSELADRLSVKDGISIRSVEQRWDYGGIILIFLEGDGLLPQDEHDEGELLRRMNHDEALESRHPHD